MMGVTLTTDLLYYGGLALSLLGLAVAVAFAAGDPNSYLRRQLRRYTSYLDRELRFQRSEAKPGTIAGAQGAILLAMALLYLYEADLLYIAIAAIAALAPHLYLQNLRTQRVEKAEQQLDTWLVALSNALKATPSLGEAIAQSAELNGGPLGEELDVAVKETKLGVPLDEAILNVSARMDSRMIASAFAALLVARQTGGNLSDALEETAGSLREMTRLEGVLRTKTAEQKAQAYVLLAIPFAVVGAIWYLDPNWVEPLTTTTLGYIVMMGSAGLWLTAVVLAYTILNVDM